MVASWSLGPLVEALRGLRGIDLVSAATLVASTGDLSRFESPRLLMGYLGLVPSEHSSGGTIRRGGITKTGNREARRMLHRSSVELPVSGTDCEREGRDPRSPAQEHPRHCLESTDQALYPLSIHDRAGQEVNGRSRCDRERACRVHLGNRPRGQASSDDRIVLQDHSEVGGDRPGLTEGNGSAAHDAGTFCIRST